MKRTGRILGLIMALVIVATGLSFGASGLKLEKTYPKDGGKNAAIENFGVKLYFNGEFSDSKLKNINNNTIKLYGPDNKELPVRILYPAKEKGVVLALLDYSKKDKDGKQVTAVRNSTYKMVISKDFVDNKGNHLSADENITFSTLNQTLNTAVYMLMTLFMFGGIAFFTMRGNKKKEEESGTREEKFNPYKEAKRTGKSIEEVLEKEKKERAKREAKEAKKEAKKTSGKIEYLEDGHYQVKGPKPIGAAGGKFKPKKKAKNKK